MSNITKEQWEKLEETMANGWVSVRMRYQGYELYISRVKTSESKTALAVYIDDVFKSSWGYPAELLPDNHVDESKPTIIADVWKKRTKARYSAKHIKTWEKIYGKRRAKKENPDLHDRWEYFEPLFPKASVLCRQFKKLKGLELINKESI